MEEETLHWGLQSTKPFPWSGAEQGILPVDYVQGRGGGVHSFKGLRQQAPTNPSSGPQYGLLQDMPESKKQGFNSLSPTSCQHKLLCVQK